MSVECRYMSVYVSRCRQNVLMCRYVMVNLADYSKMSVKARNHVRLEKCRQNVGRILMYLPSARVIVTEVCPQTTDLEGPRLEGHIKGHVESHLKGQF